MTAFDAVHPASPEFEEELAGSLGFKVVTPSKSLGRVEVQTYRDDRLYSIVVRRGRLRPRRTQVRLDEIRYVFPSAGVIFVDP